MNKYEFKNFNGKEADSLSFLMIPKLLIEDDYFKDLSRDAMFLYALLLDRMHLSIKNSWLDENGDVFIIYTIDEMMKKLRLGKTKTIEVLKELDSKNGIGLIEKKRQGLGKPNLIYVKNFVVKDNEEEYFDKMREEFEEVGNNLVPRENGLEYATNADEQRELTKDHNMNFKKFTPPNFKKFAKRNSRISDNELQEDRSSNLNNTNYNNTNINNNIYPIYQSSNIYNNSVMDDKSPKYAQYEKTLKANIRYDSFIGDINENLVDDIFNTMLDVLTMSKGSIKINSDYKSVEIVKSIFLKIKSHHISYIVESIRNTVSSIRNIRSYLITTIYNSYFTYETNLVTMVNYDLYGQDNDRMLVV